MPAEQPNTEKNPGEPLKEMFKKCMDAEGYVIFTGILSNETDEKGNRLLKFEYRRFHMSFDDVQAAVKAFREEFMKDVQSLFGEADG